MSSRVAEKERRRQQRVDRERAAQRAERRARARRAMVAGGVALLAVGAVTALLAFGGEDSGTLQLSDGQRIVVSYGPTNAPAPGGIER